MWRNGHTYLIDVGLQSNVYSFCLWYLRGDGAGVVVDGGGVVQKPRQILKYTINIYTNQ
jgi:hypothetical protein